MRQSIYEQIHSAVNKSGQLDSDFSLPSEDTNGDITFAPGAWDGMLRYHLSTNEQDMKEELQHWACIIEMASQRQVGQAILEAEKYGLNHSIYPLSDDIVRYLMDHENDLNLGEIIYFGIQLLLKANEKEAVKLGFLLLELFELEDLELYKTIIRTLALYDEFTFYAGFHMQNWRNGNQEIFDAAKKVTGWGRIHLVDKLKPETEEIKLWLLTEGINNDVMPDHSALTIYHKADLIDHLKAPIDHDLYCGISNVISALLSEEPVMGISTIEEKEELLGTFLQVARSRKDLRTEDYSAILDVIDYVSDKESLLHLKKEGDELINDSVKKKILQETKKGNSFGLAIRLDLPYEADAYRFVQKDFQKYDWLAGDLIKKGYHLEELLDFLEENIILSKYICVPDQGSMEYQRKLVPDIFDFILQSIRHHVGFGHQFIRTGICSWKRRLQNGAIKVMQCWIEDTGLSLKEISPELQEFLETAISVLICDDEVIDQLIAIRDNTYSTMQNRDNDS